jgi:hypothetical protein
MRKMMPNPHRLKAASHCASTDATDVARII